MSHKYIIYCKCCESDIINSKWRKSMQYCKPCGRYISKVKCKLYTIFRRKLKEQKRVLLGTKKKKLGRPFKKKRR